jgi:predicted metal-dependent HD superfamily phosphohydrolase
MKSELISKTDNYVFDLFKKADTKMLMFHNYKHTYDVVMACIEIGSNSNISDDELEILILAAWFHDVGYLESFQNHEELGVKKAVAFLTQEKYPSDKIELIKGCIRSTKMGVEPQNLLEEIIVDADLKGLSKSNYTERSILLREECKGIKDQKKSKESWLQMEIEFLTNHSYHTKYAQLNFHEKKVINILKRKAELEKYTSKSKGKLTKTESKKNETKQKLQKSEIPEKGIETMFRTALKNHMELSAIADNKANIMLSINALIMSILISNLFSKFDKHEELIVPSVFMLLVCLATIILATLSTRPKVTSGKFSTQDVKDRKANLLFFGNFHNMTVNDYEWGMKEIMKDKDYLYGSLIRDLHSLGVVLAKKYTFLRLCYLIFMYGMVLSVIIFGVSIFSQSV